MFVYGWSVLGLGLFILSFYQMGSFVIRGEGVSYKLEEVNGAAVAISKSTVAAATDETVELENQKDGDEELVEIREYIAKQTTADVSLAPALNEAQLTEFMDLAQQYSALFKEAPGTTNLIVHHTNPPTLQYERY